VDVNRSSPVTVWIVTRLTSRRALLIYGALLAAIVIPSSGLRFLALVSRGKSIA